MLKEIYDNYKAKYEKYILLIKKGNFYISINNDAYVMNSIYNYKINYSNIIKVGFPCISISKITRKLDNISVNYLIIDKDISFKQKFKDNNYSKYIPKYNYNIYLDRIDNICSILKKNIGEDNFCSLLYRIEKLIWVWNSHFLFYKKICE